MKKTEKKYWVNGLQTRGGNYKTFTISIGNIGIMFDNKFKVYFYKLVPYIKYESLGQVFESDWGGWLNSENK